MSGPPRQQERYGVRTDASSARLLRSRVAAGNDVDGRAFAERCEGDRHHFRFTVSPDDAGELESLRNFTRELIDQASRDLGTRLDWRYSCRSDRTCSRIELGTPKAGIMTVG
jgi:type IV secretory pathway VirD2 relaxase